MKNKIYLGGVIFLLLVGIVYVNRVQLVHALGFIFRSGVDVSSMRTSSSTTSPNYLNFGLGTTTLNFQSDIFSSLTLYLQVVSSSTNTGGTLNIEVQGSDDNVDFFTYDPFQLNPAAIYVASSSLATASTSIQYTYQPANRGSTTTKAFILPYVPSRFTKIIFTEASTSPGIAASRADGMTLWANVAGAIKTDR